MPAPKSQSWSKVGKVSTESVLKCTGKNWDQWIQILRKAGADHWEHRQIVSFLKTKYRLGPWWEQGVATGFELALGKKIEGYSKANGFSMTTSRTLHVGAPEVWKFLFSEKALSIWLSPLSEFIAKPGQTFENSSGIFGEIRTLKKNSRLRMTWTEAEWEKPSILQVHLVPKGKNKMILVFQQDKLPDGRLRMQMRRHWVQVLVDLIEALDN